MKCPKCDEERRYLLTIRDGRLMYCHTCDFSSCPDCHSKLQEKIGYIMGSKTCDGYKCTNCDWEEDW